MRLNVTRTCYWLTSTEADKAASAAGLAVTGLLGVVAEAKRAGIIDQAKPLVNALIGVGRFWIGRALYAQVLAHMSPHVRGDDVQVAVPLTLQMTTGLPSTPRMSTRQAAERLDLLQGTLDLLILRTLRLGPCHGHAIAKAIARGSDDVLQVE